MIQCGLEADFAPEVKTPIRRFLVRGLFSDSLKNLGVKPQGEAGVRLLGHREYVGGLWEELGRLQFDFMVQQGLQPHHYLCDIACGSLRAGVHFISYLEAGHYLGIEKEGDLVRAGVEEELGPELNELKQPRLVVSSEFEFDKFDVRPDFAIAQSLFTHLPSSLIDQCMSRLRPFIREDGSLYATFHETHTETKNPDDPHDHGYFAYTRAQMVDFGARNGWDAVYIGEWNHPRGQVMMRYYQQPAMPPGYTDA